MSMDRVVQLRKMARMCGTWAIARHLAKLGVSLEDAVKILATKRAV